MTHADGVGGRRGRTLAASLLFVVVGWGWMPTAPGTPAPRDWRCAATGSRPLESAQPRATTVLASGSAGLTAKLYVANWVSGDVTVIDPATAATVGTVQITMRSPLVPLMPGALAVAPDGRSVWVTAQLPESACSDGEAAFDEVRVPLEYAFDQVVVIDPATDAVVTRIKLPSLDTGLVRVSGVVIDRESRYAYVSTTAANQIIRIDARTFEIVGRVDLGPGREAEDVQLCGDGLVVANGFGGRSLSILSTETGGVEEVPLNGVALRAVCSSDGRFVFASLFDTREVVRYEVGTGALTRIALPKGSEGPLQMYLTPDDRRLFVCDQGTFFGRVPSDKLYEIDPVSAKLVREIVVGHGPGSIVSTDGGSRAYVTAFMDGAVSVVNLKNGRLEPTSIRTGTGPKGIGYWSGVQPLP